jgi:chitodextrinase
MRFHDILRSAILGLAVLAATLAGPASAQIIDDHLTPLSPVIGIAPTSLDFGNCTPVGQCAELTIDVFNDVNDPTSILEITDIVVNGAAFARAGGQNPPYTIPGDGTRVTYTIRFCPTDGQAATGGFVVSAGNATNSPQEASLAGTGNTIPSCDAGGPYAGLVNAVINFDGSGSSDPGGSITAYAWNFGDGATGSGPNPTHQYAAAGNYTATLTVTDNCGATSTCEAPVTITQPENIPPTCDAGGPYAGPANAPIQFDGTGSSDPDGTIVSYAWDFGDGATGSGATPTHTYTQFGLYTVTLCVTDDDQARVCCTTTAEIGATPVEPSTWGAIKSQYKD